MQYEKPSVEVMIFEENNIITTSNLVDDGIGNGSGNGEGGSFNEYGL